MPPDLSNLFPIRDVARFLPTAPAPATIFRWRTVGTRGRILETVRIGGRIFTSHDRLMRFLGQGERDGEAMARPSNGSAPNASSRKARTRRKGSRK